MGTIFVNGTNDFTAGSAFTNWSLSWRRQRSRVFPRPAVFRERRHDKHHWHKWRRLDQANFTGNLTVTGAGLINLYGNAILNIATGVGVTSGQTINFVSANGNTNGAVFEFDALHRRAPATPDS